MLGLQHGMILKYFAGNIENVSIMFGDMEYYSYLCTAKRNKFVMQPESVGRHSNNPNINPNPNN